MTDSVAVDRLRAAEVDARNWAPRLSDERDVEAWEGLEEGDGDE